MKRLFVIFASPLLALVFALSVPLVLPATTASYVLAQDFYAPNPDGSCPDGSVKVSVGVEDGKNCVGKAGSDLKDNPIIAYLRGIISWAIGIIGILLALALVVAGYQWMTSQGQPDQLKKAKSKIANVVISLLLLLLMSAILRYLIPGVFS